MYSLGAARGVCAGAKELAAAIDRFLRTLPEKDCNLFLRRYWYVDSISVIADRYGMKENTVKSILFRTREKLRKFTRRRDRRMREEKALFRAIGDVGDDLIARADEPVQRKARPVGGDRGAGVCLIAVGLARLVTMAQGNTSDSTAALDAAAPETAMMQATEDAKSGSAENGALKSEGADDMMDAAANDGSPGRRRRRRRRMPRPRRIHRRTLWRRGRSAADAGHERR